MACESTQMADLNKMAAPKPAASVLPQKAGHPAPKNFNGCTCQRTKCKNLRCPCYKGKHECTSWCKCQDCDNMHGLRGTGDSKQGCRCTFWRCETRNCHCYKGGHGCTRRCKCENCANINGVRESDSDNEPKQADDSSSMAGEPTQVDNVGSDPNKRQRIRPSSDIEPEQADSSSMASESTQKADLNKMAAKRPSTFVEPRTIFQPGRPVPKNYKGCKCLIIRCQSKNCPCFKGEHTCTSWCKCQDCDNMYGLGGGGTDDSKQGCTCKLSGCVNKRCICYKGSHKCTPRCKCENCANPHGVGRSDSDTEPEQADDTSIQKPTQMDSGGSSPNKRLRIR